MRVTAGQRLVMDCDVRASVRALKVGVVVRSSGAVRDWSAAGAWVQGLVPERWFTVWVFRMG